jgi:hypothetical protein
MPSRSTLVRTLFGMVDVVITPPKSKTAADMRRTPHIPSESPARTSS